MGSRGQMASIEERSAATDGGGSSSGERGAKEGPPLASYATLAGVFLSGTLAFLIAGRRGKIELPDDASAKDLVLIGAATHKLSRLIAKDRVTAFARAPFREIDEQPGTGEVSERPRGSGMRRAMGELLGCPYCLDLWISGGMSVAMVLAPRETRLVASTLTASAIADGLQLAHLRARSGVGPSAPQGPASAGPPRRRPSRA